MKRQAFLLGLFSTGSQTLLIRELISSLNGSELFIGTALAGWLVSIALGAYVGGGIGRGLSVKVLFAMSLVLLPVLLVAARMAPLAVTTFVGEAVGFVTGAALSILIVSPLGLLSGWLFASIAELELDAYRGTIVVYLIEGIGAFFGGVFITFCAGRLVSTLTLALLLSVTTAAALFVNRRTSRIAITTFLAILTGAAIVALTSQVEKKLDSIKYFPYRVVKSFDTPYSHQTILERDGSLVMLTDNIIEATYPDPESAENATIAALLYRPSARTMLLVGRGEFGIAQLAAVFAPLRLTAVDSRSQLDAPLDSLIGVASSLQRINDDPVAFVSDLSSLKRFDIIVIGGGEGENHRTSRLLTTAFIQQMARLITDSGVIIIPMTVDTDRFLSREKTALLSPIYTSLAQSFPFVHAWPGSMTVFFASPASIFDCPFDSLAERITRMPYRPHYVHTDYLFDRLDSMKVERLRVACSEDAQIHTIARPILPHRAALFHAVRPADRLILGLLLDHPRRLILIPLILILFFAVTLGGRGGTTFPLFLFFIAGFISLSLELLSFYIYQSTAGSLYSDLAALIGAFMLGLSAGTYLSHKTDDHRLLPLALELLAAASLLFWGLYRQVPPDASLLFHLLFLFTIAAATGTLFVAVSHRYYTRVNNANRGTGYALDVLGSSAGALLTTTMLLPVVGLNWLMLFLLGFIALSLVGALRRVMR